MIIVRVDGPLTGENTLLRIARALDILRIDYALEPVAPPETHLDYLSARPHYQVRGTREELDRHGTIIVDALFATTIGYPVELVEQRAWVKQ